MGLFVPSENAEVMTPRSGGSSQIRFAIHTLTWRKCHLERQRNLDRNVHFRLNVRPVRRQPRAGNSAV
jgi:hypothetical protein